MVPKGPGGGNLGKLHRNTKVNWEKGMCGESGVCSLRRGPGKGTPPVQENASTPKGVKIKGLVEPPHPPTWSEDRKGENVKCLEWYLQSTNGVTKKRSTGGREGRGT